MENKCNKIAFSTEEEAREELERILGTQRKPWKKEDKKPCRFYEEGGKYYLTSSIKLYVYEN